VNCTASGRYPLVGVPLKSAVTTGGAGVVVGTGVVVVTGEVEDAITDVLPHDWRRRPDELPVYMIWMEPGGAESPV